MAPHTARRRIATALLATWLAASASGAFATEVGGVKIDDDAMVGGQKLLLNGAGIRTRLLFKVYVAALYLPQRKNETKDVLALNGAKRVGVIMLRDVSSDELGQALTTGIRKNATPEEVRRFGPQLQAMEDIFRKTPKLKQGESFSLDWVPRSGTVVLVDRKPVAEAIPDEAFYNAVLRIWLGDEPADGDLKTGMLGGR